MKALPQDTDIIRCWACRNWHQRGDPHCLLCWPKRIWRGIDWLISTVGGIGGKVFENTFNFYFKVLVIVGVPLILIDMLFRWLFY